MKTPLKIVLLILLAGAAVNARAFGSGSNGANLETSMNHSVSAPNADPRVERSIHIAWEEALRRSGYVTARDSITMPGVTWKLPDATGSEVGLDAQGKYILAENAIEAKDYDVLVHEMIHAILYQVKGEKEAGDENLVRELDGIARQ